MEAPTPLHSRSQSIQSLFQSSLPSMEDFRAQVHHDLSCLQDLFLQRDASAPPAKIEVNSSPLRSSASSPPGSPYASSHSAYYTPMTPGPLDLGNGQNYALNAEYFGNIKQQQQHCDELLEDLLKQRRQDNENDDDDEDDASTIFSAYLEMDELSEEDRPLQHLSTAYLHYKECGCRYTVTHATAPPPLEDEPPRSLAERPTSGRLSPRAMSPPRRATMMPLANSSNPRATAFHRRTASSFSPPSLSQRLMSRQNSSSEPDCPQSVIDELANLANPPSLYTSPVAAEFDFSGPEKLPPTTDNRRLTTARYDYRKDSGYLGVATHDIDGACTTCSLLERSLPASRHTANRGNFTRPAAAKHQRNYSAFHLPPIPYSRRPSAQSEPILNGSRSFSSAQPLADPPAALDGARLAALLEDEAWRNEAAEFDITTNDTEPEEPVEEESQDEPDQLSHHPRIQLAQEEATEEERRKLPRKNVWRATRDLAALVHNLVLKGDTNRHNGADRTVPPPNPNTALPNPLPFPPKPNLDPSDPAEFGRYGSSDFGDDNAPFDAGAVSEHLLSSPGFDLPGLSGLVGSPDIRPDADGWSDTSSAATDDYGGYEADDELRHHWVGGGGGGGSGSGGGGTGCRRRSTASERAAHERLEDARRDELARERALAECERWWSMQRAWELSIRSAHSPAQWRCMGWD